MTVDYPRVNVGMDRTASDRGKVVWTRDYNAASRCGKAALAAFLTLFTIVIVLRSILPGQTDSASDRRRACLLVPSKAVD